MVIAKLTGKTRYRAAGFFRKRLVLQVEERVFAGAIADLDEDGLTDAVYSGCDCAALLVRRSLNFIRWRDAGPEDLPFLDGAG